jgi:RecA-family ATPase
MLFHSAVQFRDAGISQAAAEVDLLKTAHVTGLTDAEARHTIASAYRGPRREPIGGGVPRPRNPGPIRATSTVRKAQKNIDPKQLPDPIEEGLKQLIQTCFRPGENIAIGDHNENQGRHTPSGGCTFDYDELLQQLDERGHINRIFGDEEGLYIRVNPLRPSGGRDDDVTAWRHVLVEFDRDQNNSPIPKEKQYAAILDSGLPVSAIIDSGNKSVHAWVRVDAENKDQFKERVEKVWAHFEGMHLDSANRNASRYSRCPDAVRTLRDGDYKVIDTVRQQLLQVSVGAKTWEEWEVENEDDGLKPVQSLLDLLRKEFPKRTPIIEGLLLPGKRMVLGSPPKSHKTWTLFDLALSIAGGLEWAGLQCNQGKMFYADLEVGEQTMKERSEIIMPAKFPGAYPKDLFGQRFDYWDLEGDPMEISILVDKIIRKIQGRGFDVVLIDPLYKTLGHRDENNAGDMTDFLSHLTRLSKATGAAVIYAHHYRKGSWRGVDPIDMLSGSGVIARDANTLVALHPTPIKGSDVERYTVHAKLREFPRMAPFVIKRGEGMILERDTAIYAANKRETSHQPQHNILDFLPPDGLTAKQWEAVVRDKEVSSASFYRQLGKLKESGDVLQDSMGVYSRA